MAEEENLKPSAGSATIHIGAATTGADEAKKEKAVVPAAQRKKPGNLLDQINGYLAKFTKISDEDKVTFFRLMATMINAGISITKSLKILQNQVENVHFQQIISEVEFKIENGASFSEAMASYRAVFNDAQIGMVESGEATGRLNQTLLQIATETEKASQLRKKIKGAMIYPITVILIMIAAMYAVMTLVMPQIKEVFEGLGGELPRSTQMLIAISDFAVAETYGLPNAILSLLVLGVLFFLFMKWKVTQSGKRIWSNFVMILPLFGKLMKKGSLARFCRSLSTLTNSGIGIVKALYITASSVGNPLYEERIKQIADDVKRGITMGENIRDDEKFFPPMVVGMVNVAEQTAQVDSITGKLADFYEEEVDEMVKNLSSLMEPIIIVVLGGTVGFLVISVMMPILQSSDLAFGG